MPASRKPSRAHATRQRAAISEVLDGATGPLNAEEIWELTKKRLPDISLRTVFRNLQERVDADSLVKVEFPGRPPSYEKPAEEHHPHFSCLGCGTLFSLDFPTPDIRSLCKLPRGFTALSNEITLFGYCASCSIQRRGASTKGRVDIKVAKDKLPKKEARKDRP